MQPVRMQSPQDPKAGLISAMTGDPGVHMYNQAKFGPVDVITGDYLAGKPVIMVRGRNTE